jgi:hypothetical protein
MIDISPFTEDQWYAMCSAHLSMPEPLAKADRTKPFIYDRKWGVFHCPFGHHTSGMRVLLGFHLGEKIDPIQMSAFDAADLYLEKIPGTAFLSGVGSRLVRAWSPDSLTVVEKRLLGPIDYIGT